MCANSRNIVIFVYTWPAMISFLIASISVGQLEILSVVKLVIAVTLVSFGVYFYNDLKDLEDDLKNLEMGNPVPASRPIGSGLVTKTQLKLFIVVASVTGLVFAYSVNYHILVFQVIYLGLGFLYSTNPFRLKKRFLFKQLTIALGVILADLSGAYAVGVFNSQILFMLALNTALCIGVNPIIDIRDMPGDRLMGVKTIPVVWGPETTIRLYFATLIAIGIGSIIGYVQMGFSIAMPLLAVTIVTAWIYVSLPLLGKYDDIRSQFMTYFKTTPLYFMSIQLVPLLALIGNFYL
jgi:4-hydroxybenzoate polyprenyltransferase